MDHFSTVLQRPPHFDEDGSNGASRGGGLRDILNPVSSTTQAPGTPGAPAPPRPHSSFSLRSPTQQLEHHHPNPYSASPSSAAIGPPSGSRSILNNPFGSSSTPSLPPPLQAPLGLSSAAATSGLQHPPRSPLHAPPVYYTSEVHTREPVREKSASRSFYDPTTDSKRERERRVSETGSWLNSARDSTPKVNRQILFFCPGAQRPCQATSLFHISLSLQPTINLCLWSSSDTFLFPRFNPPTHQHEPACLHCASGQGTLFLH
jgi:DNA helicase INO80